MDFTQLSPEEFISNTTSYMEIFNDPKKWNKIPMLNYAELHELRDHSLVRFRGMIQDMQDPEIYLERYVVTSEQQSRIQDGKFRDTLAVKPNETVDYDSPQNVHGERRSLFLVTIPGYNSWAEKVDKEMHGYSKMLNDIESSNQSLKRPLEDDNAMETEEIDAVNTSKKLNKQQEIVGNINSAVRVLSREYLLNSPIPDRPSKACLIKIYTDFDRFTLNSIVDVIGFLSVDPILDGTFQESTEFDQINEIQAMNPPPSLIPRLHAICIRDVRHVNPLLNDCITFKHETVFEGQSTADIYKDIQLALTQCLFGDHIAAEYFMAHLISTVYVRSDLQTLGQFCLNISNIPSDVLPEYTALLYEIIEMILPASHYFAMTLENMNTVQFTPKKDYQTNKLTSGLLQLAPHTHLVLDETKMISGKLENNGVEAVASLAYLINNQKIKCNFQYYNIEFNLDIPVVILSEGKSMIPSNCYVPLNVDGDCVALIKETIAAVKHFLTPKLTTIRKYLTVSKMNEFNMHPDNMEMIQNDFVDMRRRNNATAEDLHNLLVLSRLLGLCQAKNGLDVESWNHAKELETVRKRRIQSLIRS